MNRAGRAVRRLPFVVLAWGTLAASPGALAQTQSAPAPGDLAPPVVVLLDCGQQRGEITQRWCKQYNAARAACKDRVFRRDIALCMQARMPGPPPIPCDADPQRSAESRARCADQQRRYLACVQSVGEAHVACMRAQGDTAGTGAVPGRSPPGPPPGQ